MSNATLPSLAVTGATGAVGGRVAAILASAGRPVRLLARSPERLPQLDGGVPVAFGGFGDRASVADALAGVETLLMVSAAESADRLEQHLAFVDEAAAAGVRHVVYTSFYGASPTCTFTLGRQHHATEERIRASGMAFTFLRDNFYLDFLPHMVGEDGVLRGPARDGRVSAVTRDDVAACASRVLADPEPHAGSTYDLTGPEAITLTEAAAIIGAHQGREVTFHDETLEEAYESRQRWPAPDWQYDAWVSTYTAIAEGEVAGLSDDVRRLTGRRPTSLAELLAGS